MSKELQEKVELRVSVSSKTDEIVRSMAEERGMGIGEMTDHLVKVAHSRLRALRKYAKSHPQEKPEKKAPKPKKKVARKAAPVAKAPRKAKKVAPAAQEAAPAQSSADASA